MRVIPKVIHYVWVGPKAIAADHERYISGWKALNPDYEIVRWDERNIDFSSPFVRDAYAVGAWNRVANYARANALYRQGGIYLDTDVELRKPLDDLRSNTCFLGFQQEEQEEDWVNNAVMGAVPGHWFMDRICRSLRTEFQGWRHVLSETGPALATRLLIEAGLAHYADEPQQVLDVTLYPARYFYPYGYDEQFSEACVTSETYGIHRWSKSWVKEWSRGPGYHAPLRQRLLNRLGRHAPRIGFAAMRMRTALLKSLS
jgi:mannosyltransferase OCH1-like enzyme